MIDYKRLIRNLIKSHPNIEPSVMGLYHRGYSWYSIYILMYSKYQTWWVAGRHYNARIDPTDIIYINPTKIDKYYRTTSLFNHSKFVCEVTGGDWSEYIEPVDESRFYRSFQQRFVDRYGWEETDFYTKAVERIHRGKTKWGCSTERELIQRLSDIDDLYYYMKKEGYKSQRELVRDSDDPIKKRQLRFAPNLQEVMVNVHKNGELIFYDGRHRFGIARLLGIESIPVRFKGRHKTWQMKRDNYKKNQEQMEANHPDLKNV